MKHYLFIITACLGLFTTGCNNDDDNKNPLTTDEIVELPYSKLTPQEQKVKLENDALSFLDMAGSIKNSTALLAYQTLTSLLNESEIVIPQKLESTPRNAAHYSTLENMIRYSSLYGTHTWDASSSEWVKTESNTGLTFIFPASPSTTSNTATLTITGTESNVGSDVYYPALANGTLKIDNKTVSELNFTAEYQNQQPIPTKSTLRMSLNEYVMSIEMTNGTQGLQSTMSLKYNDNEMFFGEIGCDASIHDFVEADEIIPNSLTTTNISLRLAGNLAFVGKANIRAISQGFTTIRADRDQKWENLVYDEHYYTNINKFEKEYNDSVNKLYNENMALILASVEDRTKIATFEYQTHEGSGATYTWDAETEQWEWGNSGEITATEMYYRIKPFLRFNDNTCVEFDTYFSEGFEKLIKAWGRFVADFS